MSALNRQISKYFPAVKIESEIPVRFFSFIKTGGLAENVIYPKNISEILELTTFFEENKIEFVVLGKCSNVLFSDKKISLVIIKTDLLNNITINGNNVYAECGVGLCHLGVECMKAGLCGFEFACGIPGSIGGSIVMNAGAFGGSISDVVKQVYIIKDKKIEIIERANCGFTYRNSIFSKSQNCVVGADFELSQGCIEEIRANVSAITLNRCKVQPKGLTLGSTFKNPLNYKAGELIDKAGLKGFGIGGAYISEKHANFIINSGEASSDDIKKLIDYIKQAIYDKFGVLLQEEIRYIGEF